MNDPAVTPPMQRSAALARNWWAVLLRGLLGIVFGIFALLQPAAVAAILALVFGIYLLVDGVFALTAAIRAATHHGRWAMLLLEGILDLIVGVLALAVPGAVVLGAVWVIAAWGVVTGGLMLAAAFRVHGSHGNWLLGLAGLVSVVWGVLLWFAPIAGALVLTIWLGAYALIFGVAMIAFAFRLRHAAQSI